MTEKKKLTPKEIRAGVIVFFVIALIFAGIIARFYYVSEDVLARRKFHLLVTDALEDVHFSGSALISADHKVIYINSIGDTNGVDETSVQTMYPIFSLTKQFTGYMVGCLEKEGKIHRSDKLSLYFPECSYGDEVTVSDLLTMTSGIPEYVGYEGIWGSDESYKTEGVPDDQLLSAILSLPLENKGEYKYSNSNYYLLGRIIEKASGKSYKENIKSYIVDKSGFKRVEFNPQEAKSLGHVWKHDIKDATEYHESITFGAGNLCSSITNLYQWQNFLYSDEAAFDIFTERDESGEYDYGTVKHDNVIAHQGGGMYHRHIMVYDKDNDIQIILLNNESSINIQELMEEIYPYAVSYKAFMEKEEQKNVK